LEIVTEPDMLH